MIKEEIGKRDISTISLIIANLIPLMGVLFFNWSLFSILILYWVESAVIGFYTILKMIVSSVFSKGERKFSNKLMQTRAVNILYKAFMIIFQIPFFSIHYGMFMFGHLIFI